MELVKYNTHYIHTALLKTYNEFKRKKLKFIKSINLKVIRSAFIFLLIPKYNKSFNIYALERVFDDMKTIFKFNSGFHNFITNITIWIVR